MKLVVPALVLTLICGIAALALAAVQAGTAPVIAEQERQFTLRSIRKSLPSFDNVPDQDVIVVQGEDGSKVCVYRGRSAGSIIGVALERSSFEGYSGEIAVLVGVTPEGQISCGEEHLGVQILRHAETPGLGSVAEAAAWRQQFCGHAQAEETFWAVRKDGGEVDQLTGATITARAVVSAVRSGLQFFEEHREAIMTGEPGRCEE